MKIPPPPGAPPPPIKINPKMFRRDSAGDFIEGVVQTIREMEGQQDEQKRLVLLFVLADGQHLPVLALKKIGHNAIVISTFMNGRECTVVAHQAAFQVIMWFEAADDRPPRPPIGFASE